MKFRIDELDVRLVKLLESDAKQSSNALAKQLNVSSSTVRRRLDNLISNKIIKIAAVVVDNSKLGFPVGVVLALDIVSDKLDLVVQALFSLDEIKWLTTTTGRFDIIALARFHSTDEMADFLQNTMAKIKGIRDSETFVCLRREKWRYVS